MEPIKISSLRLENVKRVRAVAMEPTENGLTIVGGRNGQGKTSVLDAIAWCLGGDKYKPTTAHRDGSVLPPDLEIRLSNGLLVQRKGKASSLTVTDLEGKRAGQTLLNEFVSSFAIDLPKFLEASDKEKAAILLQVIGVEAELKELEEKETTTYNRRRYVGQEADRKKKFAAEMPWYPNVPDATVSALELIQRQQEILLRNAENAKLRQRKEQLGWNLETQKHTVEDYEKRLAMAKAELARMQGEYETACTTVDGLEDEATEELEADIQRVDEINRQVRANLDKQRAEAEARDHEAEYDTLTAEIEAIRKDKRDLLNDAKLPLPGLSVENGVLLYNSKAWDCMSGSEQMIVGASIAAAIKPQCGFILLDKMEQLDRATLDDFSAWLVEHRLQGIATRVSTGAECTIIIEDGEVEPQPAPDAPTSQQAPAWKEGTF